MSELTRTIDIKTALPDPDSADTPLSQTARFGLLGSDKAVVGVYNNLTESITLNAFKVVLFPNATAESVDGPSTGSEWTSPVQGNVIQHGNPVDPTTLAAGEKMYFTLDKLKPMHSLQVLASVASGQGKLKVEFNRG